MEVDDRVASSCPGPRTPRLEQGGWKHQRRGESAPCEPQQERVELPVDVPRHELGDGGGGDRAVGAAEAARHSGRINVLDADGHAEVLLSPSSGPTWGR